jgi:solute carrier family 25 S-adenosylmethionine transporter 26
MSEDELESIIMSSTLPTVSLLNSLIAGGLAGTTVDVALFPIDTIKTRLQAPQGFAKAGGFRGIYNGLGAAAAGSAPGAALFFSTYEAMKPRVLQLQRRVGIENEAVLHMVAASLGEAVACMVWVPTEVVKAKMQTSSCGSSVSQTVRMVLQEEGGVLTNIFGGLYRGYGVTLLREIPFAMIQFPMYEKMKVIWGESQGYKATPLQAAVCGSVSGGIGAAATTPLDVIKTRLMLGKDQNGQSYKGGLDVLAKIWKEDGAAKLFAGLQPRVMWISIGGFVFLGSYESYCGMLQPMLG